MGFGNHRLDLSGRVLWRDQIVFELGEPIAHDLQRIAADLQALVAGGEVEGFHDALDDAPAVVSVENVEAGPQSRHLRLDPQLPRRKPVKGADPVRCGVLAKTSLDAADHLAGRLVGEGDGENARR